MGTRQQITAAIGAYRRTHGHPPNLRELAAAMGLDPSTIHYHVTKLRLKDTLRSAKDRM